MSSSEKKDKEDGGKKKDDAKKDEDGSDDDDLGDSAQAIDDGANDDGPLRRDILDLHAFLGAVESPAIRGDYERKRRWRLRVSGGASCGAGGAAGEEARRGAGAGWRGGLTLRHTHSTRPFFALLFPSPLQWRFTTPPTRGWTSFAALC